MSSDKKGDTYYAITHPLLTLDALSSSISSTFSISSTRDESATTLDSRKPKRVVTKSICVVVWVRTVSGKGWIEERMRRMWRDKLKLKAEGKRGVEEAGFILGAQVLTARYSLRALDGPTATKRVRTN